MSQSHLARFYLRSLEMKESGGDPCMIPNEDTNVVNLEHVLPENPGEKWGSIPSEVAKAHYKRIGNLALLSNPINSAVGNDSFAEKKPFLKDAPFTLTKAIAKGVWILRWFCGRMGLFDACLKEDGPTPDLYRRTNAVSRIGSSRPASLVVCFRHLQRVRLNCTAV